MPIDEPKSVFTFAGIHSHRHRITWWGLSILCGRLAPEQPVAGFYNGFGITAIVGVTFLSCGSVHYGFLNV
jgi:hypothetical protein